MTNTSLSIFRRSPSRAQLGGVVLLVDRFGNLVTNIDRRTFEAFARSQPVTLRVAGRPIAGVVATYADIRAGEVCALFGSTEHLELAANGGSAATALDAARGAAVEVTGSRYRIRALSNEIKQEKGEGEKNQSLPFSLSPVDLAAAARGPSPFH